MCEPEASRVKNGENTSLDAATVEGEWTGWHVVSERSPLTVGTRDVASHHRMPMKSTVKQSMTGSSTL